MSDDVGVAAGDFSAWLAGVEAAIAGTADSDVPCGTCTACCRSSQFVPIAPDESDTLAHIPAPLLVPVPWLPPGHVVLGYDADGCCPLLGDGGCSIYAHRPRTCRAYDCRVFPASGVDITEKPLVAERAARWRFTHPTENDRAQHDAVRAAAAFLADHAGALSSDDVPVSATQRAVVAVEVHDAFLAGDGGDATGEDGGGTATIEAVRVALARRRPAPAPEVGPRSTDAP